MECVLELSVHLHCKVGGSEGTVVLEKYQQTQLEFIGLTAVFPRN